MKFFKLVLHFIHMSRTNKMFTYLVKVSKIKGIVRFSRGRE